MLFILRLACTRSELREQIGHAAGASTRADGTRAKGGIYIFPFLYIFIIFTVV